MKPKETKLKYSNMIQLFNNGKNVNPSQIYQKKIMGASGVGKEEKERKKRLEEYKIKNCIIAYNSINQ